MEVDEVEIEVNLFNEDLAEASQRSSLSSLDEDKDLQCLSKAIERELGWLKNATSIVGD